MAPIGNPIYAINPQPVRLSNSILDGEFDDNVLDTLVPDLVPNLNELDLLSREVYYQQYL